MVTTKKETKTVAPVKAARPKQAATAKSEVIRKKFTGIVLSDKMTKTIVVKVEIVKIHPKYHKRFVISRKYKVHDEREQFKTGDSVIFVSCRPMSKDKKWRVLYQ
ncbi:MAG: 30S ribosomal protein S17 [Candidatus Falkowbacteria bacterium]